MKEFYSDRAYQVFSLLYTDLALSLDGEQNEDSKKRLDGILVSFNDLYINGYCDSPIENTLMAALLFESNGYTAFNLCTQDYLEACCDVRAYTDIKPPRSLDTIVIPQARVGKYFADFLFVSRCEDKVAYFIVECDGHDFHEKTKEQAAKDKKRDRWFQSQGISVLRFTGSEVYKDPYSVTEEIGAFAMRQIDGLLQQAGLIRYASA